METDSPVCDLPQRTKNPPPDHSAEAMWYSSQRGAMIRDDSHNTHLPGTSEEKTLRQTPNANDGSRERSDLDAEEREEKVANTLRHTGSRDHVRAAAASTNIANGTKGIGSILQSFRYAHEGEDRTCKRNWR